MHQVISFSVINYVVSMRGPHGSGDNLFFCLYPFPISNTFLSPDYNPASGIIPWDSFPIWTGSRKIRDKEQIISLYLISVVEFIYSWRSAKPNKFAFALA